MDTIETIKCPICKEPYKFYMHYAGDQSAYPQCREKARQKEVKPYLRRD